MNFTALIKVGDTAIAESSFEASSHYDAATLFCKSCVKEGAIWGHLVVSSNGRHVGIYQQPLAHKLQSEQASKMRADLKELQDSLK